MEKEWVYLEICFMRFECCILHSGARQLYHKWRHIKMDNEVLEYVILCHQLEANRNILVQMMHN